MRNDVISMTEIYGEWVQYRYVLGLNVMCGARNIIRRLTL